MSDFIIELKAKLDAQLSDLTDQIRASENNLLSLKESYLKVAGALEILTVIKNKDDEQTREALIAAGMAD
jgi:prefoldin subunit 5